jgi:hypothetical protein
VPKLNFSSARIAARRGTTPAFQEVCVPLYAPAPGEHRHALTADDARDEDTVVDASGITIGGDDVDDDFY